MTERTIITDRRRKCRRTYDIDIHDIIYKLYDRCGAKKQKLISGLQILIMMLMFSVIVNGNFAEARDNSSDTTLNCSKYYKCIVIEYGDTLWEIAAEYKGSYYDSVYDYIDEVMAINHLTTDRIHAGQYLTVPYYENDDNHNKKYSVNNLQNQEVVLINTTNRH